MNTDYRKVMLDILAGRAAGIPWVPRLDLWYNANKYLGTLPQKYKNASLVEIIDDLDWGCHAILPNFRDLRNPDDDVHRALGVYNLWNMPFRTVFENTGVSVIRDGDKTTVEYDTPKGRLTTETIHNDSMRKAGITISHIHKYVFSGPENYDALGYLFENARVEPNYDGFTEYSEFVGKRGLPAAFVNLAGSPMHLIQRELMPVETFFFEMYDHAELLAKLAEQISSYWTKMLDVVYESPATLIFIGANYDSSITHPPFFEEHIKPWLKRYADRLHSAGKYLLTHTDGENTGLLQHYLDSGFDIADSICPKPMTRLTLKEVREFFDGRIIIMGGIPSVALLPESIPDREFIPFLDKFFEDLGDGRHQILGVSDTVPPAADWNRLLEIGRRCKEIAARVQ